MEKYHGTLAHFFETGCEGSYWVLERSDRTGYDQLVFLKNGDELTIFHKNGEPVYKGVIWEDRSSNLRQRPMTAFMQPVSNGHWVHWLQAGVDPDVWGNWFFSEQYTGVLVRQGEESRSD